MSQHLMHVDFLNAFREVHKIAQPRVAVLPAAGI